MTNSQRKTRRPLTVDLLEGRLLLTNSGLAPRRVTESVVLTSLNNSGVKGTGTVTIFYPVGSIALPLHYKATLSVKIQGLEPNQVHLQTINGQSYLSLHSTLPPASAANADPSAAGLGPNVISNGEAEPYLGEVQAALNPLNPNKRGQLPRVDSEKFSGTDIPVVSLIQSMVVCGETVNGQYVASVPVAAAIFVRKK